MSRVTTILEQLLEVTPAAPADADVPTLVAGISIGIACRRAILDGIGGPLPIETPSDAALLAELEARRQSWHDAVARSYAVVGNQLIGVRRARAYTQRHPVVR
jgi:hypothetical protein